MTDGKRRMKGARFLVLGSWARSPKAVARSLKAVARSLKAVARSPEQVAHSPDAVADPVLAF
jgi:hypothetical protein